MGRVTQLIDKEKVINYLTVTSKRMQEGHNDEFWSGVYCGLKDAIFIIENEVEVVKHKQGYWTMVDKDFELYECSVCKNVSFINYPYCPYCGAEMRKVINEIS